MLIKLILLNKRQQILCDVTHIRNIIEKQIFFLFFINKFHLYNIKKIINKLEQSLKK